jgi:mRNA-degrading endonuclease RelE of RelBE toxin-antitoxin system
MTWQVDLTKKTAKQKELLPKTIKEQLVFLIRDIEEYGPVRGNWPNYSKLKPGQHHCHLKKGRPTYVAIWEERNKEIRDSENTNIPGSRPDLG